MGEKRLIIRVTKWLLGILNGERERKKWTGLRNDNILKHDTKSCIAEILLAPQRTQKFSARFLSFNFLFLSREFLSSNREKGRNDFLSRISPTREEKETPLSPISRLRTKSIPPTTHTGCIGHKLKFVYEFSLQKNRSFLKSSCNLNSYAVRVFLDKYKYSPRSKKEEECPQTKFISLMTCSPRLHYFLLFSYIYECFQFSGASQIEIGKESKLLDSKQLCLKLLHGWVP